MAFNVLERRRRTAFETEHSDRSPPPILAYTDPPHVHLAIGLLLELHPGRGGALSLHDTVHEALGLCDARSSLD
jgi:hypothetical protein